MSRSTYDKLNTSNRQPRNKETADPLPANYHDTYFKWLGYKGALYLHFISLDIDSLGDAHERSDGRYKSVHQAFSLGYNDGVNSFIKN